MSLRNLPLSAILLSLPLAAHATSSSSASLTESLSTKQAVPPTIMFVVDLSTNMNSDCFGSGNSCLVDTLDAIKQVALHFPDVKYGVVGTGAGDAVETYTEIAPVGSTYTEIAKALASVTTNGTTTRNFSEVIESLARNYYDQTDALDTVNDDGDAFTGDWDESPIAYDCSTTHVIVLASGRPLGDDGGSSEYASGVPMSDVRCDELGVIDGSSIGADIMCHFDNAVSTMFYYDYGATGLAPDPQRVVVSAVGLGLDSTDVDDQVAEALYASAGDSTEGYGMYGNAASKSEAISTILAVTSDIMSGVYSRSTPVISGDGAWLTYSYYEVAGDNPLAQGHILAYKIDDDPSSSTYGALLYNEDHPTLYYGAEWDGGWLLYSRIAETEEVNDEDRDGYSHRDIYFFDSALKNYMGTDYDQRRMSFDQDFVDGISSSGMLTSVLAASTTATVVVPALPALPYLCNVPDNTAYDLNRDGCQTILDVQTLVDFTRGVSDTEFRYLDAERGRWKLQDSPYSTPAIITKTNSLYSNSMSYRRFLQLLTDEMMPDVALVPANDGMLHAFALEDDEATLSFDESGEELWAWIPSSLIWRDRGAAWAGGLVDAMWYGRTYLFDGSPVVEDVWIDLNADGEKDCSDADDLDTCEWRRVVVVQQGLGGTRTLALDVTYTDEPTFLWEVTNTDDSSAMGMTTGRPTIFNVYDRSDSANVTDRWVAMWPSGRPAQYDNGTTNYFQSVEGSLYLWGMGDDTFSGGMADVGYSVSGDNIETSEHPDSTWVGSLDSDSDGSLEHTYIAAPPTVVDVDADGDADVAYFPLSLTYDPASKLGPTVDDTAAQTWIYKAIINETDPSDFTWCKFYDPAEGAPSTTSGATVAFGSRPDVYYAVTTAWLGNQGSLGVYWGTGSPFTSADSSVAGAMFLMQDDDPESCTSTAKALTCDAEEGGFYSFAAGEKLTSDPIVYSGVLYFATYTPDADACEIGTGRLYGLDYESCSPGLDTDGDGALDSDDETSIASAGYVSNVAIGDNGKIYYTSATDVDVQVIAAVQDAFKGTATVGWTEMF